jgi:thioredoxin 1
MENIEKYDKFIKDHYYKEGLSRKILLPLIISTTLNSCTVKTYYDKDKNKTEISNKKPLNISKNGITILEFSSKNCAPCKRLSKVLDEVEKERDFKIIKIDIEDPGYRYIVDEELGTFKVVPYLIIFKDGKNVYSDHGFQDKSKIYEIVDKL